MARPSEEYERELRELREIMPALRACAQNRDRIEKILGHLIDDREQRIAVVDLLIKRQSEDILPITEKLEVMMPTLEHIVQNKQRIEWLWSVGRKYGGGALALIVLISTFQEHASKLVAFIRGLLWSVK